MDQNICRNARFLKAILDCIVILHIYNAQSLCAQEHTGPAHLPNLAVPSPAGSQAGLLASLAGTKMPSPKKHLAYAGC